MSNLEELIEQLCPEGVELKELGAVMSITRGASPRPILNYITNDPDGISWIKIGDVNSKYKYITKTKERITKKGAEKSRYLKKGDFVLSNSMSFGRPYILAIDGCIHDGWISMQRFDSVLLPDFLYHLLRSDIVQNYWKQKASNGTVQNLNADIVRGTIIPIPPLLIQQEIVTILDKFTQLEAELEAELQARRTQYEYYRNELLNFEGKEVEWSELQDFVFYSKSRISATTLNNENYVGVESLLKDKQGKTLSNYVPTTGALIEYKIDDILIGNIRPYLKKIWFATNNGGTNGDVLVFRIKHEKKKDLIPKFLFFLLSSDKFFDYDMQSAKGGKMPRGDKSTILKYRIPLPPIAEQNRIVAILDKFDKLVNDKTEGLPAEIESRRKQYEYYRGKLLDFKELMVNH